MTIEYIQAECHTDLVKRNKLTVDILLTGNFIKYS